MAQNPSLFIGSSSEGLDAARAIAIQLDDDVDATLWNEGPFALGSTNIESLVEALDRFDFAALVLTPDDRVDSRQLSWCSPRDNVMFELGLFMGRLGRERVFVICSTDSKLKIPTDLLGTVLSHFNPSRPDGNLLAAVGAACFPIRERIRKLGRREQAPVTPARLPTKSFDGADDRRVSEPMPISSTQAKVLQVLTDSQGVPRTFQEIRRELVDRFASDTRPSVVQDKLNDLVAVGLIELNKKASAYEITPLGTNLMEPSEAT